MDCQGSLCVRYFVIMKLESNDMPDRINIHLLDIIHANAKQQKHNEFIFISSTFFFNLKLKIFNNIISNIFRNYSRKNYVF